MLPSDQYLNQISDSNEEQTKKIFEQQGFKALKLDRKNKTRKTDFLMDNQKLGRFICEVKTIFSAGTGKNIYNKKPIRHVSTLKTDITNDDGMFEYDSLSKIQDILEDAQRQYKELVKYQPEYENLPFVVALFLDELADSFDMIPRDIFGFNLISAIIKLEKNHEIKEEAIRLSKDELKEIIGKKDMSKFPPPSLKWKVLMNNKGENKISCELLHPYIKD